MNNYIIVDVTGLVTFIRADNERQAVMLATHMGLKPFIVRQA